MGASDWIASGALLVAIVAAVFSGMSWWTSRRSAGAAERAVTVAGESKTEMVETNRIARESKEVAERAVSEARRAADAAKASEKLERDARHDSCRPPHPGRLEVFWKDGGGLPGYSVFGKVGVGVDYRVAAEGLHESGGTTHLFGPELVKRGMPKVFHIQTLPSAGDPMSITVVDLRFWPPSGIPGADEWGCGCGADEDAPDGHRHPMWARQPPDNPGPHGLLR